jgi:16S rRNA (guanine527-N7)-methyltransferase
MTETGLLAAGARNLGLALTAEQLGQFAEYSRELQQWNQRVNLTAITDEREIETKHFLDSLAILKVCRFSDVGQPSVVLSTDTTGTETSDGLVDSGPFTLILPRAARVIDIGTGAGFPGLPLKIAVPTLHLVLVESIQKKTAFLHHIVQHLGLRDVDVVTARAEELGHAPQYRASADLAVARAVTKMPALAELTLPFCRQGGFFVAYKGRAAREEAASARRALGLLGGKLTGIVAVKLLKELETRFLIVVRKVSPTPAAYPRRAGMPTKAPL